MNFLEDVLAGYGVFASYWPWVAEEETSESARVSKYSFERTFTASDDYKAELLNALNALKTDNRLPLVLKLGDVRTEAGRDRAALSAYEAAVLEAPNPHSLCELGYFLLQRARVEELPLCDRDFDSARFQVGGHEPIFVTGSSVDAGPEFPKRAELLDLAIHAFGLAYIRCVVQYFLREAKDASWTSESAWDELIALDGLRAAFIAVDDLDGLDSVSLPYFGWLEDYGDTERMEQHAIACHAFKQAGVELAVDARNLRWDYEDIIYPFAHNLEQMQAYLRGRRKHSHTAPTTTVREIFKSELLPVLEQLGEIKDSTFGVHRRLDNIIEKLIDLDQRSELIWDQVREWAERRSDSEKKAAGARLESLLSDVWIRLHSDSRADLVDASLVALEARRIVSAFRCAVIGYSAALERELSATIKFLQITILGASSERSEPLGKLIRDLKQLRGLQPDPKKLSGQACAMFEERTVRQLEVLNRIRTKAAHPERVSEADLNNIERILLQEQSEDHPPVLATIVRARHNA